MIKPLTYGTPTVPFQSPASEGRASFLLQLCDGFPEAEQLWMEALVTVCMLGFYPQP